MVALSHSSSFSTPQSIGRRDGLISRFPHVGCLSLRGATGKPASYARVEGKVHPFFRERGAHMRWLAFKGWRFYRSRCCFRTPPAGVNFYSFNMPAQGEGMEAAVSSGRPSRALMLLPRIIPGDEPVRCR